MWNHYGHNMPWVDGVANTSLKLLIEFWQHLKSMLFIAFACISSDVVLAIGQGQGSFLHVTFRCKFYGQIPVKLEKKCNTCKTSSKQDVHLKL